MPITVGTNTWEMRSTSRSTGAFLDWASVTNLAICASVVFSPVRVTSTSSRPEVLMVAPVTTSPTVTLIAETVPARSASIGISIFIDSSSTTVSPASTRSPSATSIVSTLATSSDTISREVLRGMLTTLAVTGS